MESATNEGGKKKHSPPAQETSAEKKSRTAREGSLAAQEIFAEKKPKTASVAREGSSIAPKFMINLTSSKNEKERFAGSVLVVPTVSKATSSITDRIAQCISSSLPLVPKFVLKHPSRAKSGSPLERLATMKSDKVSLFAKVAPKLIPSVAETNSSAETKETACAGSRERSTKSVSGEVTEICALLKPDLLEDMDVCAKFVDGIKWIVGPTSFAKHTTEHIRTAILAMMQKTAILAAESMLLDQEDTKATKKVARTVVTEAYSSAEKVKKL
ncbi:uncharacterized protein LOC126611895 [Malus sylvestris]|uniref:uncharacterized protein LOC126611895 n=1 Tax=Malus sylvestris TaxID=3752 RepID=UPI0021AC76FF|nr:uncharacterized protein LOC126611895 [Malus sylvestris]